MRKHDRQTLSDYFVNDFINLLKYDRGQFDEIMERYRNREIWRQDKGGWVLNDEQLRPADATCPA